MVLETELKALYIPGKSSTTKLHPQPSFYFLFWGRLALNTLNTDLDLTVLLFYSPGPANVLLSFFIFHHMFVYVSLWCVNISAGAQGGKRVLDPWSWITGSREPPYVGPGNQTLVLCSSSTRAIFPARASCF